MPLRTKIVSSSAQRTIREAFRDLEKTVSPNDSRNFSRTTLKDVRKAARDIEDQLAARQSLRNMRRLMPLFSGLEHYSKHVEILCNGTPFLPWIWAPISLILRVTSEYTEAFEKIIQAYCRIAAPLARFQLLSDTFVGDQDFQMTLAIFYADILHFHKEAYKFVSRSSWHLFLSTSWGRFQRQFDNIIEDLQAHEALIDKTASAMNTSDVRKMREELNTMRQENLQRILKEEEERSANQYLAVTGYLKMDDADQITIMESVTSEVSSYPGTCAWITKQNKIAAWMRTGSVDKSSILSLQGHPGTGKSVLAAHVAQFLELAKHSLVVRHFCSGSIPKSTQYNHILLSILRQIIRSDPDIISHVYHEVVLTKKSYTIRSLEQLILTLTRAVNPKMENGAGKHIHVVFDGLDECEEGEHGRIVTFLERLATPSMSLPGSSICKVLISSRSSQFLTRRFRKRPTVGLSDEKKNIDEAIRSYAGQKLAAYRERFFQMGFAHVDISEMVDQLTKRAAGKF